MAGSSCCSRSVMWQHGCPSWSRRSTLSISTDSRRRRTRRCGSRGFTRRWRDLPHLARRQRPGPPRAQCATGSCRPASTSRAHRVVAASATSRSQPTPPRSCRAARRRASTRRPHHARRLSSVRGSPAVRSLGPWPSTAGAASYSIANPRRRRQRRATWPGCSTASPTRKTAPTRDSIEPQRSRRNASSSRLR